MPPSGDILDLLPSTSEKSVRKRVNDLVPENLIYGIPTYEQMLASHGFHRWKPLNSKQHMRISSAEWLRSAIGNKLYNEIMDHPLKEYVQTKLKEFQESFDMIKLARGLLNIIEDLNTGRPLDQKQISKILQYLARTTIPLWAYSREAGEDPEDRVANELAAAIINRKKWARVILKSHGYFDFVDMNMFVDRTTPGLLTNLDRIYDTGENITRTIILKALARCLGQFFVRCTLYAFRIFAFPVKDQQSRSYCLHMVRITRLARINKESHAGSPYTPEGNGRHQSSGEEDAPDMNWTPGRMGTRSRSVSLEPSPAFPQPTSSLDQPLSVQDSSCPSDVLGQGTKRPNASSTGEEPPPKRNTNGHPEMRSLLDAALAENARLQEIIHKGTWENSQLKISLRNETEENSQQKNAIEKLKTEIVDLKAKNETLDNEKKEMEDDIENMKKNLKSLEMDNETAQSQIKERDKRITAMEKTETSHQGQLQRLQMQLDEATKKIEKATKEAGNWEKKHNDLEKELIKANERIRDLKKKTVEHRGNMDRLQTQYREGPERERVLKETITQLQKDVVDLEKKLDEANGRITRLEQQVEDNNNNEKQFEIQQKSLIQDTHVEKGIYDEMYQGKMRLRQHLLNRGRVADAAEAGLNERIEILEKDLEQAKADKTVVEKRLDDALKQVNNGQELITKLKKEADEQQMKLTATEKFLESEKKKHNDASAILQRTMSELTKLKTTGKKDEEEKNRLEKELSEIRRELETSKTNYGQLQADREKQSKKVKRLVKRMRDMEKLKKQLEDKEKELISGHEEKLKEVEKKKGEELQACRSRIAILQKERDDEARERGLQMKKFQFIEKEKATEIQQLKDKLMTSDGLVEAARKDKKDLMKKYKDEMDGNMKKFDEFKNIAVKSQEEWKEKNQNLIYNNDILTERNTQLIAGLTEKQEEIMQIQRRQQELEQVKEKIFRELEDKQKQAAELEKKLTEANESIKKKEYQIKQMAISQERELTAEKERNTTEKKKLAVENERLTWENGQIISEQEQIFVECQKSMEELKKNINKLHKTPE